MSMQAIEPVMQAETAAEQILENARGEAKQILAEAEAEAAREKERSRQEAKEAAAAALAQAEAQAGQQAAGLQAKTEKLCQAIEQQAAQKMDAAVKFIVGRVVG